MGATLRCCAMASLMWGTGASVAVVHGLRCPAACGIFLNQGSNSCLLPTHDDSNPLCHEAGPISTSITTICRLLFWSLTFLYAENTCASLGQVSCGLHTARYRLFGVVLFLFPICISPFSLKAPHIAASQLPLYPQCCLTGKSEILFWGYLPMLGSQHSPETVSSPWPLGDSGGWVPLIAQTCLCSWHFLTA